MAGSSRAVLPEKILQVESKAANLVIAAALLIGTPGFVLFGWLSDRVGASAWCSPAARSRC